MTGFFRPRTRFGFAGTGVGGLVAATGFSFAAAVRLVCPPEHDRAAETGVVMIVYLDEAYERYSREGRMRGMANLKEAIFEGAVDRVRPKLMTVATTMIGLLPILYGTETGTRVMKRIVAPMVGGLVSSTVLTLVLIPALYLLWKGYWLRRELRHGATETDAHPPLDRGSRQPRLRPDELS